jgi:hypothetical protein
MSDPNLELLKAQQKIAIKNLKESVELNKELNKIFADLDRLKAKRLWNYFQSLREAGFSRRQAFELTKIFD